MMYLVRNYRSIKPQRRLALKKRGGIRKLNNLKPVRGFAQVGL